MYRKLLILLNAKERRQCFLLLVMIIIMAFLDTAGVASIMPFMSVLGNPEIVHTNPWLNLTYRHLGFNDPNKFLFFLGAVVFVILMSSILFRALTQWSLMTFTQMRNYSVSCRMFKGYLGRPYTWYLNRHSADLGKAVLSEVGLVITGVLMPAMQLIAQGTVTVFLVILLISVDPLLALYVGTVLGGAYGIIYLTIRNYLSRIGKDRLLANQQRFQVAQEALGGIKEVKIFGREFAFFSRFVNPAYRFAKHQANSQIASQMPKYFLEMVGFGGMLLIALYLFKTHGDFKKVMPIITVYAFAGYRLLPALQQVYSHSSKLRFGLPSLDALYNDILEFEQNDETITQLDQTPLMPEKNIRLKNICFTYPGAHMPTLKNLDLTIPARSAIGLVGSTGSGKTTTVDIILGLLQPQSGQILVDNISIFDVSINEFKNPSNSDAHHSLRRWQQALGYVPQHIYLADDTVAANIAFGIPENEIDLKAVIRASKTAELHDFVSTELQNDYDTLVGERGVRLSGGQRQRIGIARALYHDPAVLIFDEATSALDNLTEQVVMQAVRNLGKAKTIILIAHRLSTVKGCDCIYILEHGEIVGHGTYDDMIVSNEEFKKMALSDSSL